MTHGLRTSQDEDKVEAPESRDGFDLAQLWLLPLLLLAQILALFAGHADTLKAMRPRVKAMPEAWKDFIPDLLIGEWHIRTLTASGIKILLSGKELDLRDLTYQDEMPPGYQLPIPRSAWEAHRRMEAIARFHADPETFIRRQVQRIARTGRVQSTDWTTTTIFPFRTLATTIPLRATDPTTTIFCFARRIGRRFCSAPRLSGEPNVGLRIRAPPELAPNRSSPTRPHPRSLAARSWVHAKNPSKTRCFTRQTAAGPFPAS